MLVTVFRVHIFLFFKTDMIETDMGRESKCTITSEYTGFMKEQIVHNDEEQNMHVLC